MSPSPRGGATSTASPIIVEEVLRIHGYAHIPSMPLPRAEGVAKPTATPAQRTSSASCAARSPHAGLDEAITWSFLPPARCRRIRSARSAGHSIIRFQPILAAMRPSLLPGLLLAAKRNLDRGQPSVRLFETRAALPRRAANMRPPVWCWRGRRGARDWRTRSGGDAVRSIRYQGRGAGGAGGRRERRSTGCRCCRPSDSWYHPGRSGRLGLGTQVLASFGELHPRVAAAFDLKGSRRGCRNIPRRAARATRSVKAGHGRRSRRPALQPVHRDFAFVVAADTAC